MSGKITNTISYNLPTVVPIVASSHKITRVCRNCNTIFKRSITVSPAHNEYYRCNKCRGIRSMDFLSLCNIQ